MLSLNQRKQANSSSAVGPNQGTESQNSDEDDEDEEFVTPREGTSNE